MQSVRYAVPCGRVISCHHYFHWSTWHRRMRSVRCAVLCGTVSSCHHCCHWSQWHRRMRSVRFAVSCGIICSIIVGVISCSGIGACDPFSTLYLAVLLFHIVAVIIVAVASALAMCSLRCTLRCFHGWLAQWHRRARPLWSPHRTLCSHHSSRGSAR